jgi:hypothetical protein
MTTSKKAWSEPELIVLVRSKPEEAVLAGCKNAAGGGQGPAGTNNKCNQLACASCVANTAS